MFAAWATAGCGAAPADGEHGHTTANPVVGRSTSAGPAGPTANRRSAQQEAQRLLTLMRVPPGASPLPSPPSALPGPALGTPTVDSLVDEARFWGVDLPFDEVLAWVRAHPPDGLTQSGTGDVTAPGSRIAKVSYVEPGSTAWQPPQLEVGVAAVGDRASVLRADAVIVWLDPRPLRDTLPGRRIHLTVAEGCPATDARIVSVANPSGELDRRLLPSSPVTAALVCWYDGVNGQPFRLRSQRRLDALESQRIADVALALPLSHPIGGRSSCPFDAGAAAALAFSYAAQPDVGLWLSIGGCSSVSNGRIRTASGLLPETLGAPERAAR